MATRAVTAAPPKNDVADRLCEAVNRGKLRFTAHAVEEMRNDGLTVLVVAKVLLSRNVQNPTGRDAKSGDWKYSVITHAEDCGRVEVVVGVPEDPTARISVITAMRDDKVTPRR